MTALGQVMQTNNGGSMNQMKTSELGIILGTICLGLLGATPSPGAIAVTEAGDWSSNLSTPYVIPSPLGLGVNTITGTLPLSGGPFESIDTDVFRVNNPSGFFVTSITLDISSFISSPGTRGRLDIFQPVIAAVYFGANGRYSLPSLPVALSNPSALAFRIYGPNDGSNNGSANYIVSITATAVPEPISASAVGLVILGFALWRRWK
jgi:hypothetical protein